jgi:hypothetical protein
MRFEARDLQPWVQSVPPNELRIGEVYFKVEFLDPEMRIPTLRPVVFVGRDLEQKGRGELYFQDYESYAQGERFGETRKEMRKKGPVLEVNLEADGSMVSEYEDALDSLLRCSLRRRGEKGA